MKRCGVCVARQVWQPANGEPTAHCLPAATALNVVCTLCLSLCPSASARTSAPASSLDTLQALCDLAGLLDVLISRAPEEEASSYSTNSDRDSHVARHPKNPVFHGGLIGAWWKGHASRVFGQRLDFGLEGLIELGIHARTPAHVASFFKGNIFECDRRSFLGHALCSLSIERPWRQVRYFADYKHSGA